MSEDRSHGRDFILILASRVATALQGIVVLPIVIRWSGTATYGAYALIGSTVGLIFGLTGYAASYRYQRKVASTTDMRERRGLFEPQFTFQLTAIAIIAAAMLLRGPELESWIFRGEASFTPWLFALLLGSTLLQAQALSYFQYTLRFLRFTLASGAGPYIFMTLLVAAAAIRSEISLDTLLALQITTTLCIGLTLWPTLLREIGIPRLRLPAQELVTDARIGSPIVLELIIDFILRFSDRYLIVLFLSVTDVGRYQPAYTLASLMIFFVAITETVMIPTGLRMIEGGDQHRAERALAHYLGLFLMLAVPFTVGALMLGPSILGLLTNPEIAAASRWVTPLVALGSIFYGVIRFASLAVYVLGRTRVILTASVIGGVLNLSLNLILLPIAKDIMVPAATTLIGYAVSCVYAVMATRRAWHFTIEWLALSRFVAAATAMGGGLWLLGYRPGVVTPTDPAVLVGMLAAGALAYFSVLSALGGFGRRELAALVDIVRRRSPGAGRVQ